jgi:hypothetical protein
LKPTQSQGQVETALLALSAATPSLSVVITRSARVLAPGMVDMSWIPGSASFGILVDVLAAVDVAAALGDLPDGAASRAEADGRGFTLANAEMVAHGRALLAVDN